MVHTTLNQYRHILSGAVLGLLIGVLVVGCVTEEKITPAFPVERLQDKVGPLRLTIPIQGKPVQDQFSPIGNIAVIGESLRMLAEMLADASIARGESGVIDLDPMEYDLGELDGVDFAYVREVLLQNVHIVMDSHPSVDRESGVIPSFSFIKSLEVYIKMADSTGTTAPIVAVPDAKAETPGKGLVADSKLPPQYNGTFLALSYHKGLIDLGCDGKCFDMNVHQGNWKQVLKNNKRVTLYVHLVLDHAPKFSFNFGGYLDLRVLVDLNGI